jgi:hemolysin-activating ACP:hemolysin acyltransferase|tara:strand:+ start:82 stop:516 length:435 start_codon:yes stop_codon:yes gene_type:complete
MNFISNKKILEDMQMIISLYKKFDKYKDFSREDLYYHILPSIKLKQYKIHYDGNVVIGFTNWAFLNKENENHYLKTSEIREWNSGKSLWHIDTVCVKDLRKIMAWTKQYFKTLLNVGQSLNWVRVDKQGKIYRRSSKFKREFHR